MTEPMSQALGHRIIRFERVDSTQRVAGQFVDDLEQHGLVVRAEEQTEGRGRRGAVWLAPPGGCLMFSVLLFPPAAVRRPAVLTMLAAVSVCETVLEHASLQATIKWPNDVLVNGRKVCGILTEASGAAVVMGIGLNVNITRSYFELAGLGGAGSLLIATGRPLDLEAVFRTLLNHLDAGYAALCRGETADLEARWRHYSALVGRQVEVVTPTGSRTGRLLDLSLDYLSVEEAGGAVNRVTPEAVLDLRAIDLD